MTDEAGALVRTPQEFAVLVAEFRERLNSDRGFAELVEVLCGAQERVQVFTQPSGVGISAFAGLFGLPASTVRHYQRLGLVTPYEVNGKFRFWFHNVIQIESVRQWRDLGLTLEEIQAQRAQERLGGQAATFNAVSAEGMGVLVTSKAVMVTPLGGEAGALPFNSLNPRTLWLPLNTDRPQVRPSGVFRDTTSEAGSWPLDLPRLRQEVRAARLRLEDRLRVLEAQLKRARALEATLASALTEADEQR